MIAISREKRFFSAGRFVLKVGVSNSFSTVQSVGEKVTSFTISKLLSPPFLATCAISVKMADLHLGSLISAANWSSERSLLGFSERMAVADQRATASRSGTTTATKLDLRLSP